MDKDILADWLRKAVKLSGLEIKEIGEATDIEPNVISKILSGARNITATEMIRIAMFLDTPLPVAALTKNVRKPDLRVVGVDDDGHPFEERDPLALPSPAMTMDRRFGVESGHIPQVEGTIGAGSRDDVETLTISLGNGESVAAAPVLGSWSIPLSVLQRRVRASADHLHFLECEGNSMFPIIKDGDVVLVDQSRRNPTMPGIFALWENGGQTIKQIEIVRGSNPVMYRLIPANKDYATYEVPADEVIIIGRYAGRFTID